MNGYGLITDTTKSMGIPFEYLDAKLRGRRGRLYEQDKLWELADSPSVQELAYRLYPRREITDLLELERCLTEDCVEELALALPYLSGLTNAFYLSVLRRFQVDNLKVMLRLCGVPHAGDEPEKFTVALPDCLALPREELLACRDIGDFVSCIPSEAVRSAVEAAISLYERTGRRAFLEMALDKGYWHGVRESLDRLPTPDRETCAVPLKREFLSMRLLCALRARRYGIPWPDLDLVLPAAWNCPSAKLLRTVYEESDEETRTHRLRSAVGAELSAVEVQDLTSLEGFLWRKVVRTANQQFYGRMGTAGVVVGYFYAKMDELKNLIRIAEMLRYNRSEREIREHLGLARPGA